MKNYSKRALYESIMKDVAKIVKRHLNEAEGGSVEKIDDFLRNASEVYILVDKSGSMSLQQLHQNLSELFNKIADNGITDAYFSYIAEGVGKMVKIDINNPKVPAVDYSDNIGVGTDIEGAVQIASERGLPMIVITDGEDISFDEAVAGSNDVLFIVTEPSVASKYANNKFVTRLVY